MPLRRADILAARFLKHDFPNGKEIRYPGETPCCSVQGACALALH
jgi:hypothetical protein